MVYLIWSFIFVVIFGVIGFFIHPDVDDIYKLAVCIGGLILIGKFQNAIDNIENDKGDSLPLERSQIKIREHEEKVQKPKETESWASSPIKIREHEEKVQKPKETEYRETIYRESKLIKCEYCSNLTIEQGIGGYVDGKPKCKYCIEKRLGAEPSSKNDRNKTHRRYISSSVKRAVWHRDKKQCVQCGKRKNLQFDHIIPVSKGGNNTVRNIQILCENCNRKKSDKI